ncbi:MAG: fumarylacetoacetate hydrolase family protein [Acidobacteriota bacterium]
MGSPLVRFAKDSRAAWGVLEGDAVHELTASHESLGRLLEDPSALDSYGVDGRPLAELELLSPVTAPCQIVCQGLNYSSHRQEAGQQQARAPFNMIFSKPASTLSGPDQDVVRPPGVKLLDYELELGLVVGRSITGPTEITNDNLHEYVAGVVLTNDVSARDVQIPQQQWFKGKGYRTFCPTGPVLYLLEEGDVPRVLDLDVELRVNGELRQKANTSQLLYGPAETLTELSGLMDLHPGDLVQTGTPGGVALKAPSAAQQRIARALFSEKKIFEMFVERQASNPDYLKDGDVMELRATSSDGVVDLGVMRTRVVPEGGSP